LTSSAPAPATPDLRTAARRIWGYVGPHRAGLWLSILAFTLASLTEPLVPALLKFVLDEGFADNSSVPLWVIPVALVGLFVVRGALAFCGSYLLNWTTSRTVLDLRCALMSAVIRCDASFYTRFAPSAAVTKVVNDPQTVTGLLGGALTTLLRDGLTAVAMLAYLFYLNWSLTLLTLLTAPVLALVVKVIQTRVRRLGTETYDSQIRLASVADDIARAWRVVRTFDAGQWERERFEREARHLQRMTLKSAASGAMMSPISQVVSSVGVAIVLTLALLQARADASTIGEFVAFITAMLGLVSKARHLTDLSQPVINGLVVANACFELMDTPAEPDRGTKTLAHCEGRIEVNDVTITYAGAQTPALNGLTLCIPAGHTVALVGASGAGKTTVVHALLGFAELERGQITLDKVPIAELRKASLRKQFAVVSQDIVLFDGSIGDNVAYAQEKDQKKLEQCLRAANLWDFVSAQPDGVEASVGANGSKLSGGQRQRLAIARALYKDAKIWIFDEATSALDTESERVVQQSIEQWHGNKTLLLIAHRLSTVRRADCIYVLSQGRVAESGSHEELMIKDGLYASMVRAQTME
jgi:ATP-binding cassette, subfamily B, bacterial MsbA